MDRFLVKARSTVEIEFTVAADDWSVAIGSASEIADEALSNLFRSDLNIRISDKDMDMEVMECGTCRNFEGYSDPPVFMDAGDGHQVKAFRCKGRHRIDRDCKEWVHDRRDS